MNSEYLRVAPFYDPVTARFLAPARAFAADYLARLAATEGNGFTVLDLGCGTGLQLRELAGRGLACLGLDNAPEMLERARRALKNVQRKAGDSAANLPPAPARFGSPPPLLLASAASAPFADNSFSAVLLSLVLHESADGAGALLAESFRLANRVLLLDWSLAERNLDYLFRWPLHLVERAAGKRHYRSFSAYLQSGGLEGLVQRFALQNRGGLDFEVALRARLRLNTLLFMDLQRTTTAGAPQEPGATAVGKDAPKIY